jgi:hypothetical protein
MHTHTYIQACIFLSQTNGTKIKKCSKHNIYMYMYMYVEGHAKKMKEKELACRGGHALVVFGRGGGRGGRGGGSRLLCLLYFILIFVPRSPLYLSLSLSFPSFFRWSRPSLPHSLTCPLPPLLPPSLAPSLPLSLPSLHSSTHRAWRTHSLVQSNIPSAKFFFWAKAHEHDRYDRYTQ